MKEIFKRYHIGHFINQPNSRTQFEITRFDEMAEPDVEDPHKHTFYEIIWVESGVSKQVIDYREYAIEPGMLFFISPGQLHHFEDWQPVTGGSIMFTADFFLLNQSNKDKLFEISFLDNFYTDACVRLTGQYLQEAFSTIEWLCREHKKMDPSAVILQSLLHILVAQVQQQVDAQLIAPVNKKYIALYKNFKALLDAHYPENLPASTYAEKLHITQHHLNHVTKLVIGKTTTEAIRERSILEAKRLLTFTDHPVAEVAAQLGYFDTSYFAKVFKAVTQQAPLEFKKAISEKYRKG